MTYGRWLPVASWQTRSGLEVTRCIFVQPDPSWPSDLLSMARRWFNKLDRKATTFDFCFMIDDKSCMNQGGPAMTHPAMWGVPSPTLFLLFDESDKSTDHNLLIWYFQTAIFTSLTHYAGHLRCWKLGRERWKRTAESKTFWLRP